VTSQESAADELHVVDNADAARYELFLAGRRIGFVEYELGEGRILFPYIEVEPSMNGRGLGGYLTAWALGDCRRRGLRVSARCPFVAEYIVSHPEYHDIAENPATGR